MSWELLSVLANLILFVGMVPTLLDSGAQIPRTGSAITFVGLVVLSASLLGLGIFLGAITTAMIAAAWAFVWLKRPEIRVKKNPKARAFETWRRTK